MGRIINMMENKIHVWNHQPATVYSSGVKNCFTIFWLIFGHFASKKLQCKVTPEIQPSRVSENAG